MRRQECFDPATCAWSPLPALSGKRTHASACAVGGALYVCGGFDGARALRRGGLTERAHADRVPRKGFGGRLLATAKQVVHTMLAVGPMFCRNGVYRACASKR
mmetsp:Transcript_73366/g.206610  ORF Transcript_73366/g.206610 Transcript_73366/m.206610 type:complete len:103 (+) Transcript_73366:19-327(+)